MYTSTILFIGALAGGAMAHGGGQAHEGGRAAGLAMVTPAPRAAVRGVQARDVDTDCFYSVVTELGPPTSVSPELSSWDEANGFMVTCTYTLPASLSSDFNDAWTSLEKWATELESRASDLHPNCGAEITLSPSRGCDTSVTALYTTNNMTKTQSFAPLAIPTRVLYVDTDDSGSDSGSGSGNGNAAPRQQGFLGTAAVVVLALGVVVGL